MYPVPQYTSAQGNQVCEQRLNLNRSWYKDHSHAYNTPFYFKSYTKDLSFPIFTGAFQLVNPTLLGEGWAVPRMFMDPKV